jgi:predicted MFS family arabinose efflux permease
MYVVWLIPCAVAPNIGTMLVSRFLDGFAGSAFLSVAGGTVGDMFAKHELSAPVSKIMLVVDMLHCCGWETGRQ